MSKQKVSRAVKGASIGVAAAAAALAGASLAAFSTSGASAASGNAAARYKTTTPIKHVVVLFDENVSFDHYFGTYPNARNTDGTKFTAKKGTPVPNNYTKHPALLVKKSANNPKGNPNLVAPFRLGPERAWTCSQNHNYLPEQQAVNGGAMDMFVQKVSTNTCSYGKPGVSTGYAETMGFYDGNTVTAMWNYAQNFAMSDNSWDDNFGPSTVGALNVVSGQTHGVMSYDPKSDDENPTQTATPDSYDVHAPDANGVGTVTADPDPVYDDCADNNHTSANALGGMQSSNKNIGDLLSAKGVTWGYFAGGFTPSTPWAGAGTYAACATKSSVNAEGKPFVGPGPDYSATAWDYNAHHNPFAYYKSTSNPHHFPGTPGVTIGAADPTNDATKTGANHQYDLSVFYDAVKKNQLPAVSYVKPIYAEDGHAGNSDPIDEQHFLVRTINAIEQSPEWSSTAIVIAYDDSDGWYDHVAPKIINGSNFTADNDTICTSAANAANPLGGYQDRCGPSQRLPLLVISPYAKKNFISHAATSQSSIVRFIEDNWLGGKRIGDGSFDAKAGKLSSFFNFKAKPNLSKVLLNANGSVKKATKGKKS